MNNNSHETPDSAPSEVINFDEEVRKRADIALEAKHEHEIATAVAEHPENVDKEELRIEIFRRLEGARNAEARVKVIATILDTYGADALLGFFFPEIGDAAVSASVFAYLFGESVMAGIPATDIAKMAWYQLVDFAIGSVPIIGDIGDHFYKANNYSATLFTEHRDRLVAEAVEAGIPQSEIEHLLTSRESIEHGAKKANKFVKKMAA
ncbi:MAG: hypothetical protein ACI9QC_000034 [Oceanicoccus sp.]|jgi:hypothetical protein